MTSERWSDPAFADRVRALLARSVGEPSTLELVKLRPWSAVWRARTTSGAVYVKDNCPEQRHEAALLRLLDELAPGRVLPVVDADDGLFVTPDLGQPMREEGLDVAAWQRIVVAQARLQRELVDTETAPAAWGLTVIGPDDAPAAAAEHRERLAALPDDDPRRLDAATATRLRSGQAEVERWAEQVAALGLPRTLCHNDLHAGNVFDTPDGIVLFDLGDAVVADPLSSLLVPLNVLANDLDAAPDDARLARVADAALEVWSDLAPAAELRAALPAALQLGRLGRVESWWRVTGSMSEAERAEWGDAAASWLGTLLDEPPAGAGA